MAAIVAHPCSGIPHSTLADDVYEGYYIPKGAPNMDTTVDDGADSPSAGALVIANVWYV